MINSISSLQSQPNRIQAQNKQAKPVFGKSTYINLAGEVSDLVPKSEFDAMYTLAKKVVAREFKLADPSKGHFVNSNGDSLFIQNQTKEIAPNIVFESADKADKFIFETINEDEKYIKATYSTLADELNSLMPKNK
jgi:hypothetical protein